MRLEQTSDGGHEHRRVGLAVLDSVVHRGHNLSYRLDGLVSIRPTQETLSIPVWLPREIRLDASALLLSDLEAAAVFHQYLRDRAFDRWALHRPRFLAAYGLSRFRIRGGQAFLLVIFRCRCCRRSP